MPDSTKIDRDQSRLRILFALAAGIAFLVAARYAMLAVAQFSAGIHHTALGSFLVMGLATLCLAGSLLLWARPGWSETVLSR